MERELLRILTSFDELQLESLARSHYQDAIQILSEAVAYHDCRPDMPIVQPLG